jgi:hypothetical protein
MICTLKGFRQPQYDSIAAPEQLPDNEKMTSCRTNDSGRAKDGPKCALLINRYAHSAVDFGLR